MRWHQALGTSCTVFTNLELHIHGRSVHGQTLPLSTFNTSDLLTEVAELHPFLSAAPGQTALEDLFPVDFLLHCPTSDQPIHHHVLALPNAVSSVHALVVHRRVPSWVHNNDSVSCCQCQAQAPHLRCQEEHRDVIAGLELLNSSLYCREGCQTRCTLMMLSAAVSVRLSPPVSKVNRNCGYIDAGLDITELCLHCTSI